MTYVKTQDGFVVVDHGGGKPNVTVIPHSHHTLTRKLDCSATDFILYETHSFGIDVIDLSTNPPTRKETLLIPCLTDMAIKGTLGFGYTNCNEIITVDLDTHVITVVNVTTEVVGVGVWGEEGFFATEHDGLFVVDAQGKTLRSSKRFLSYIGTPVSMTFPGENVRSHMGVLVGIENILLLDLSHPPHYVPDTTSDPIVPLPTHTVSSVYIPHPNYLLVATPTTIFIYTFAFSSPISWMLIVLCLLLIAIPLTTAATCYKIYKRKVPAHGVQDPPAEMSSRSTEKPAEDPQEQVEIDMSSVEGRD
eukprot:TRINITY_DN2029_c2_g1_i1.p1 TRINITY_DN2029_c2_g1~~TRINITY_DN2029_c2_g1_i1.p1  ORF type:complete len:323 (+),score=24.24 TRINITY_DN2029_c2_g1_i1:55-969(+)